MRKMAEYAITVDDISRRMKQRGQGIHTRVPPKYRDPVSGKEWSGRGKAPKWIRDHTNRDGFLI
jgi:DNA-binding protein H-NS